MSAKRLKRPSSARRNIKQDTFSPFVSCGRLRRVQSLLKRENGSGDSRLDALLCIQGIDSKYSDGCTELVNYLLFGFYDIRRQELERSGFPEETIDDLMFLIRSDRVDIYCNPVNYLYFLPYIAHWKNLHVHCLKEEDYADDEKAEEFKIHSLVRMAEGCNTIGIPYSSSSHHQKFDIMAVEKWPIIQAYALEGFGGTFFTLKHEVIDVHQDLSQVYQQMDPVSMETLVTEKLPLLERQWETMLTNIDVARSDEILPMTENQVSESLRSFYNYGRVGTAKGDRSQPGLQPFVLFGCHSSHEALQRAEMAGSDSNSTLQSQGLDGKPALHMICQGVSPRSPLTCARTYFFGSGYTPFPVHKGSSPKDADKMSDTGVLIEVYRACTEAILAAIHTYAATLSVATAESEAHRVLLQLCKSSGVEKAAANRKNVQFSLTACDSSCRTVTLQEKEHSLLVKRVCMAVYDVPSVQNPGQSLGSVIFAESFLESTINISHPDGSTEIHSDYTVLTGHISRFITWPVAAPDREATEMIRDHTKSPSSAAFGRILIGGEKAQLLVPGALESLKQGDIFAYEEGIIFTHTHCPPVVLPKSKLEAINFYDGDSPSVVALLLLTCKPELTDHLPRHLRLPLSNDRAIIVFAFQPKTKAYKAVFSELSPYWKQEDQVPHMELLEGLPDELQTLHEELQGEFQMAEKPVSAPLKKAEAKLPDLGRFLEHFAAGSVTGHMTIPSAELPAILNQPYDSGSFDDPDELVITILGGLPGSHRENMCSTLTKMAKDDNRWAVLRHPIDNVDGLDVTNLQQNLTAAWMAHKHRKPGVSRKKMRALVITPGYCDIVDVVQAIRSHPDRNIANHLKIGAVTVCIHPVNTYMTDRYMLPKLLDQCAQGWVNNIVFTSSAQSDALAEIQELIRAVNSDVALLIAEKGEITRSLDIDLILSETAFQNAALVRARHLSCPGWSQGLFDTGTSYPLISDLVLRFSQPLDKNRLLAKLKGLKSSHSPFPFTGNIYHLRGKVRFSDTAEVFELRYMVLTGHMSLAPAELQPTPPSAAANGPVHQFCVVFSGCQLETEKMKTWLRGCARQKPEKKVKRTRQNLTKPEIKRIHGEHHLEPLPEGWFYNGTHYVSMVGDKSDTHPDLEKFLKAYLDKTNKEVDQYNAQIDQGDYHDLFE